MRYFLAFLLALGGGFLVHLFGDRLQGAVTRIPQVQTQMTDSTEINIDLPAPEEETSSLLDAILPTKATKTSKLPPKHVSPEKSSLQFRLEALEDKKKSLEKQFAGKKATSADLRVTIEEIREVRDLIRKRNQ